MDGAANSKFETAHRTCQGAGKPPGAARSVACVLLPVLLIAVGQIAAVLPAGAASNLSFMEAISNPVPALIVANLAGLPLLFGRRMGDGGIQGAIWSEAVKPAGTIILAIGAGGALKQVLVAAGLGDLLAHVAAQGGIPAIPMAWFIAVCIRLATGSATVATITAAGIMPAVVAATGASPEWTVLAIGAGSVFCSHVNDPGFWLVRSYLGTTVQDTFRTWSLLETLISVFGLTFVLVGSAVL